MSGRILIVEDEIAIGEAIAFALETAGYETALAGSGAAALSQTRDGDFDLVILDLILPDISGIEVCARERDRGYDVPILVLTARRDPDTRARALDEGASAFMTKPFAMRDLLTSIHFLLDGAAG